jgi:hypothetical protein
MKGLPQNQYIAEFSPEEYEQYVKPAFVDLQNNTYYNAISKTYGVAKNDTEQQSRIKTIMGALAQYMFLEEKYGRKPLTISGPFNPYFIAGLPSVVFDETCSFMAKPLSITHNINSAGDATTSYMMNFAVDFDSDDLQSETDTIKHTKFPLLPSWVPDAYQPGNIDDTYATLLGRNGAKHAALGGFGGKDSTLQYGDVVEGFSGALADDSGMIPQRANIAKLANSIFSIDRSKPSGIYDKANDQIAFARNYVTRPVTTYAQYMGFYGMTGTEPGERMSGDAALFKHIVKIQAPQKSGDIVFYDASTLNNKDKVSKMTTSDYVSNQTCTPEKPNPKADAVVDNYKYRKMDAIQADLNRTGYRG